MQFLLKCVTYSLLWQDVIDFTFTQRSINHTRLHLPKAKEKLESTTQMTGFNKTNTNFRKTYRQQDLKRHPMTRRNYKWTACLSFNKNTKVEIQNSKLLNFKQRKSQQRFFWSRKIHQLVLYLITIHLQVKDILNKLGVNVCFYVKFN